MPICRIILPYDGSEPPALPGGAAFNAMAIISYYPPPAAVPYYLAELSASQAVIDALAARPDCLLLCYVTEEGFTPNPIAPTARVAITKKIKDMDFPNLGLINAAIQASQNTAELAVKLATKAFARHVDGTLMTESDVLGGYLNRSPNL